MPEPHELRAEAHELVDYQCDDCGEVFSGDERKAEHYRAITNGGWHWGPWQYSCPECGSLDIAEAPEKEVDHG